MKAVSHQTATQPPRHSAHHTPLPWSIERTSSDNWIGPLRADNSGKVESIVCHIDRKNLKPEALARADGNADLIVQAVNALMEAAA